MKSYLLFTGIDYYPGRGVEDYLGDFDTEGEAREQTKLPRYYEWDDMLEYPSFNEWYQIVNSVDMKIVSSGRCCTFCGSTDPSSRSDETVWIEL